MYKNFEDYVKAYVDHYNHKEIKDKKKIINYKDILIHKIHSFEEILLIGSGKGVTSVYKIDELNWKRKKKVCYKKINKIYNSLA